MTIAACSDAGWEGYGPLGQGFLGSAYGYVDKQLGPGTWQVEYVGIDAAEARQGAIRRASEVCRENGFGGVDFTPSVASLEDLVVASGTARCQSATRGVTGTSRTVDDRIAEIDAELAALRAGLVTSQAPPSSSGIGALNVIAAGVNQYSTSSINRNIERLEAERASLMRQRR
jgi:hypothetical protein